MKIPKYMHEPVPAICHRTINMIAKALEIDAAGYHSMGRSDATHALRMAAKDLRRITDGSASTLAKAFGWESP